MGEIRNKRNSFNSLRMKTAMLVVRILLSFALYWALQSGSDLLAGLIAGLIFISMIALVWLV
jgi:hypothetical protein